MGTWTLFCRWWMWAGALASTANAQVFMRSAPPAPALGMGDATVSYPQLGAGLGQEAVLGLGEGSAVWIGSMLPFGLVGWRVARLQAAWRSGKNDGLGLDLAYSGIEGYGEQRLRLLYGRRLSSTLLIGGGGDVLRVSAGEYGQATALTFGLGALANPIPSVWLGAQVYNPIQVELAGTPAPAALRIGASWQASAVFIASAEVEKDLERAAQVKVGMAYRPMEALALRMGARAEPLRLSLGAEVRIGERVALASAAEWHPVLGITPALCLGWYRRGG